MSNITQVQVKNNSISETLRLYVVLNQTIAAVSRRFDHMGSMLGFNDFTILYHLHTAEGNRLRRIDLAEKTGLTASGITRLLPPLEKLKLIERQSDPRDARVSFVALTMAGNNVFNEALERAEYVAASITPDSSQKDLAKLSDLLQAIRRQAL